MPFRVFPRKKVSSTTPLFSSSAPADHITAYTDGGARGNPGPAGSGIFIQDAHGKKLAALSLYLGDRQTNNFAEYSGVIAALEYALAHKHPALRIVTDSLLVVNQLNGEWKVKHPDIKTLYDRARQLIRQLEFFEIRHVLRGGNKEADRLANEAMDRRSSVVEE
jgi:ribonuclease HI